MFGLLSINAAILLSSASAVAALSGEELSQLGSALTPMGAERAGNKDGTIPAWTGKWLGVPQGVAYKDGDRYPDPYPGEQPRFVITAQNMAEYQANLTDGQKALFKQYPSSFKMMIFPSHRDFRYDEAAYKGIRTYAQNVKMTADGNGLKNYPPQAPFPVPHSGQELMWNLRFSSAIGTEAAVYDQAVVYPAGSIAWGKWKYEIWSPMNGPKFDPSQPFIDRTFARVGTDLPLSDRGSLIVSQTYWDHEGSDLTKTWVYNPGTRRVRQSPEYGFDQPQGPGGFRTVDDDRLFNGSGERYNWKILGKKEIYVPYDDYKLNDASIKYASLLTKGHPNPEFVRYELHRVWVLEATLKSGFRHQYAKRVIYLDEDTWMALLADNYDAQGQLWRTNMQTTFYAYDAQRFYPATVFYQDLISSAYMADRMTNEGKVVRLNSDPEFNEGHFSPDSIRASGL